MHVEGEDLCAEDARFRPVRREPHPVFGLAKHRVGYSTWYGRSPSDLRGKQGFVCWEDYDQATAAAGGETSGVDPLFGDMQAGVVYSLNKKQRWKLLGAVAAVEDPPLRLEDVEDEQKPQYLEEDAVAVMTLPDLHHRADKMQKQLKDRVISLQAAQDKLAGTTTTTTPTSNTEDVDAGASGSVVKMGRKGRGGGGGSATSRRQRRRAAERARQQGAPKRAVKHLYRVLQDPENRLCADFTGDHRRCSCCGGGGSRWWRGGDRKSKTRSQKRVGVLRNGGGA